MVFVKGKSGNPGGRAKTKPITDELRRQLADIAHGGKLTNLQLTVSCLIATSQMVGSSESVAASKLMLAYLDGLPEQKVTFDVREEARKVAEARGLDPGRIVSLYEELARRRAG